MAAHTMFTAATAAELLRTLADANGGWLNSKDYARIAPKGSPSFLTLYHLFNCGSWADICAAAGIYQSYGDTLPPVLDEATIKEMIRRNYKGATMYSEPHRQQVALWCLKQAAAHLGEGFSKADYEAVAKRLGLSGSWVVAAAFGDSWNRALVAAGLYVPSPTKLGTDRKQRKGVAETDARQQEIIDGMIVEAVPADWRLHEWPMTALDSSVTTVTAKYRHITVADVGMVISETRMVLR